MKKFLALSVAAAATMAFGSTQTQIDDLQAQIDKLKKQMF